MAAQTAGVVWESLGTFSQRPSAKADAVVFLPAVGPAASDPARDDIFYFGTEGVLRYAPGQDNGEWGNWRMLCPPCRAEEGVSTPGGALVAADGSYLSYSANRGLTWDPEIFEGTDDLLVATLPGLEGVILGASYHTVRSDGGGARGTWTTGGATGGNPGEAVAEVPPSGMLPRGRLLMGVWNGITYSDDGGASWRRSSAYRPGGYIGLSFAFVRAPGHPYGGTVFAGLGDTPYYPASYGTVARSDDGGVTWAPVHRFDPSLWGMTKVTEVKLLATSDGALWAGLADGFTGQGPAAFRLGAVVRSTDGGATWAVAGLGYAGGGVSQLILSRTGALYAASDGGVWRTRGPAVAVAGEAAPEAAGLSMLVRPNPSQGRAEVVVALGQTQDVRAVVFDALGREVAVVLSGPVAAGERALFVDTSAWPAGVYVVRVVAGGRTASARLVVAR